MKAHPVPKQHAAPKAAPSKPAARPAPAVPPSAARPAAPIAARSMPAAVAKTSGQKIIAPASPPAQVAAPAPPPAPAAPKKPVHQRHGFKINEWIVYPAHGVGRIVAIDEQEIAGIALELFVITFEKDKMTLRVPTGKSESVGMRKLAEEPTVKKAIETLKGRARIKRTMWSRRAQEYEAKINSGDLIAIAEVVRDLYRSESQPEQSYSERQLYEAALDRMAREIAVVEKLDERGAVQRITDVLAKSARGRRLAAEEAEEKAA
jgi:CarD family transcriptional regulator